MEVPSSIHILSGRNFRWINVTKSEEGALKYLQATFRFQAVDLADCRPELQRPKVISRPKYLFAILVFPVLNPHTKTIEQHEVDIFVTKRAIVTIHDSSIRLLEDFFQRLKATPSDLTALFKNPALLLSYILDELLDSNFPLLQNLSTTIDALRARVLHETSNRAMVHDILRVKDNIVAFRKATQPAQSLLKRMLNLFPHHLSSNDEARLSFERLIDHTDEITESLAIYREAIDAVEDTHSTLISARLNDILKTLTVFSVVLLSLTLLTNIFIIPAFSTPIIGVPGDFWALMGVMLLGALAALGIFKKKRWL